MFHLSLSTLMVSKSNFPELNIFITNCSWRPLQPYEQVQMKGALPLSLHRTHITLNNPKDPLLPDNDTVSTLRKPKQGLKNGSDYKVEEISGCI